MFIKIISNPNFIVNLYLHMVILLTFLSIFFFGYISKQSRNGFNSEINKNVTNAINTIDLSKTKEAISKLDGVIRKKDILKLYEDQDKQVETSNKSLLNMVLIIVLMLWIGFIVFYFANRNNEIDFKHIIKENMLTLVMIAIIEFTFFKCIAWHFIPVEPDYLPNVFHDLLSNKFNV